MFKRLTTKADREHAKQFFIPKGAVKIQPKGLDCEFYIYERGPVRGAQNPTYYAVFFRGTAARPTWNYSFQSAERREDCIKRQIESEQKSQVFRAEQKAKRNKPTSLGVGHILVTCWGYEQTNREFYKVVEKKGERTLVVRQVASISAGETGWMQGKVVPSEKFIGEPKTVRSSYGDSFKVDGHHASLWDGKPVQWTGYH